jgi:uncharacterized protein (UPF0264 family)
MKAGRLRMLVSVRTLDEALLVAAGGADFIDLKEPRDGALGGLPPASVRAIVAALRAQGCRLPVSATIGDLPMPALPRILAGVASLRDSGVDYIKVGIEAMPDPAAAAAVLDALATADIAPGVAVVPVFVADAGLDLDLLEYALARAFAVCMVDTADKQHGSLFDVASMDTVRRFVQQARQAGALVGLAGALRLPHVPLLAELAPDFAGFRSAVCRGERSAALDPLLLRDLATRLRAADTLALRV